MMIIFHIAFSDQAVREKIHHKEITLAGNSRLNIYGHLRCASGKRMKRLNRVFFSTEQEAIDSGYRPCGHCMKAAYKKYKQ